MLKNKINKLVNNQNNQKKGFQIFKDALESKTEKKETYRREFATVYSPLVAPYGKTKAPIPILKRYAVKSWYRHDMLSTSPYSDLAKNHLDRVKYFLMKKSADKKYNEFIEKIIYKETKEHVKNPDIRVLDTLHEIIEIERNDNKKETSSIYIEKIAEVPPIADKIIIIPKDKYSEPIAYAIANFYSCISDGSYEVKLYLSQNRQSGEHKPEKLKKELKKKSEEVEELTKKMRKMEEEYTKKIHGLYREKRELEKQVLNLENLEKQNNTKKDCEINRVKAALESKRKENEELKNTLKAIKSEIEKLGLFSFNKIKEQVLHMIESTLEGNK